MAQTFDVQLRLTADGRGLVVETAKAKQVLEDTGKTGKQAGDEISRGWSRAKTSVMELGRAAAAAVGIAGLAAVMASSVGQAKAFEVGIAEVSTLLEDTSSVDGMTQSVRDLAKEYGQAPAAQAKALYQIISAGATDAAVAVDTLDTANKLALGGITQVETAADGLTTTLNAYGPAAGSAMDVSDRLFVAMKGGKTTIDELSRSIGGVAPIAAQAGVTLDELLAATAALTKGGMATSVAMQGVRAATAAVLKPSAEAAELAGQLGLQFDAAALKSKGLAQFLTEVQQTTGGSAEQLAILFGGVEALAPVMALTGNQAGDFAAILAGMGNAAGQTEAAVAKIQQTADFAFKRLASEVGDGLLSVGNVMLDVLAPAALLLADNLTLVATVITARLVVAALAAVPALAAKTAGMTAAAIAARGLAASMALVGGPVGIAVLAIAGLTAAALNYEGQASAASAANVQLIRATELLAKAQGASIDPALDAAKAQKAEAESAIQAASAQLKLAEARLAAIAAASTDTSLEGRDRLSFGNKLPAEMERVQQLKEEIADLGVNIGFLNVEIQDGEARSRSWREELAQARSGAMALATDTKDLAKQLRALNKELDDLEKQRRDDLIAEEDAAQGLRQLVSQLQREASQVGMTRVEIDRLALARQLANLEARVGTALSREQVEALTAEAIAAFELRVAKEEAAIASEELARQSTEAARESAYVWDQFTGQLATAFADGTDSVKDLWKRMLDDLKRQLIQSGLLKLISSLFGGGNPGLALAASQGGAPSLLGSLLGGGGFGGGGGGFSLAGLDIGLGGGFGSLLSSAGGFLSQSAAFQGAGLLGSIGNFGGGLATAGANVAGAGFFGSMGTNLSGAFASFGSGSIAAGLGQIIPVIGQILAIATVVDKISGGKLFGTSFRPESSETALAIGAGGGDASASVTEVRQRSLFRGRKWRTRDIEAGAEAEAAAAELFAAVEAVIVSAAESLQTEVPGVIDAAIRTLVEYDKKGNETSRKILVDIIGRTWEEATAELAATRITAEAIIQTIDSSLGGVAEAVAAGVADAGASGAEVGASAGGRWGEEYGRNFHKAAEAGAKDAATETAGIRGEASAIAERWRGDAEQLMAGAQFLLAAATDIRAGTALLGDDSTLTAITDLTEELAVAGEPLLATYQRMAVATALMDHAVGLASVEIEKSREEFVRWSTGIAEAAGGLDRLSALTQSYFNTFYTEAERATMALDQANAAATREFGDIDLDFADFQDAGAAQRFRTMFENLLPTLSEEAVVQWYEAAAAFGIVIDLTEQYADVLGDAEAATAAAARSLAEFMQGIEDEIADRAPPATFAEQLASIQSQTEANIATAREMGATEEQINRIRYLGQLQMNEVLAEQSAAIANYESAVQGLQDELDGAQLSPFQREIRDINRWAAEAESELHAAAQAAGMLAASEEDLMLVRDVANQRLASLLSRFMGGIDAQIASLEPASFAEQLAAIQSQTEANIATAREMGATEEQIARIRHLGQLQMNQVLAEQAAAIANYESAVQRLQDELDGASLSPFQVEVRDINRWAAEATAELNAAAVAAGMLSATEQDLMLVRDVANQRMEAAIQRLTSAARGIAEQLYGSELERVESRIAALQQTTVQSQLGAIADVGQAATDMYERQRASIQSIQDWLDQQLLGDLSTLTPEERLAEARAQFEALAAAAAGGDADALAQLPAAATALLREGRDFWASSEPYTELESFVRSIMEGFAGTVLSEPTTPGSGPAGGSGGGPTAVAVSPELQALYEERDALLAQLDVENRQAQAEALAVMMRDLMAGTGDSLAEVADRIDVSMRDLVTDLLGGLEINFDEMTGTTAHALAGVAQQLGVDLTELAANVGVELGTLGDRQSLLNQALDLTLDEIPDELRERLLGPLDDVRSAVTEADANAALEALKAVTEGMPPGIRNLLAPFFEDIDPAPVITELSTLRTMDAELQVQTGHLAAIEAVLTNASQEAGAGGEPIPLDIVAAVDEQLAALWSQDAKLDTIAATLGAIANFDGVPGYEIGTPYVPRTGPAILHEAEMVLPAPVADFVREHGLMRSLPTSTTSGADVEEQVRELRLIRETLDRRLERLEQRLEKVETAERDGAREISSEFRRSRDDVLGRRG
jgi:TP901 family phage tail tape measure protein